MSYVLIVGAKSDIAKALARQYAEQGYDLYLAARESNQLEDFSNDIRISEGENRFNVLNKEKNSLIDACSPI